MLSKADTKYLRSLRQNKFRGKHGEFLAEGTINVLDFLAGPLKVKRLLATKSWLDEHGQAVASLKAEIVSRAEMQKVSALKNPSEVLAVVEKPEYKLPDLASVGHYVLALDEIRDPGNLGTMIRTADWFGIGDVVCSENTVDAYNPKVVQATMGSLGRVRVHYADLRKWLAGRPGDVKVFGAVLHGNDIRKAERPGKGVLLIGSEAQGISQALYPMIDRPVQIPAAPGAGAESLNAAVAAAIVCHEFCNHRRS